MRPYIYRRYIKVRIQELELNIKTISLKINTIKKLYTNKKLMKLYINRKLINTYANTIKLDHAQRSGCSLYDHSSLFLSSCGS